MEAMPIPKEMLGRYELLHRLARGGMAEVHLARIRGAGGFSKLLVVKRMLPHLNEDPEFVEMFLNEGRIAAQLSHPNICQVFELGEIDGKLFLAMEYLDGLPWTELLLAMPRSNSDAVLRCTISVISQICEGLRYAHEFRGADDRPHPIVHRDVSPQNLFVTRDGACKLLDFGVAKVLTESSRTRSGMLKGKLAYMAPEQIRGEKVDPRADVFSTGVVVWESLTGTRLFQRTSDYQIWRAITEEPIPSLSSVAPGFPPAMDAVIARALARDVTQRYPSIAAFASDLRDVVGLVGGPLTVEELAQLVKTYATKRSGIRRRQLGQAGSPALSYVAPTSSTRIDLPSIGHEVGPTASIQLRQESVAIGRRPRNRLALSGAAVAIVAAIGFGIALFTLKRDRATASHLAQASRVPAGISMPHGGGTIGDKNEAGAHADPVAPAVHIVTNAETAPAAKAATSERTQIEANENPAVKRPPRAKKAVATEKPTGTYSVDSNPYATIYIDGKSYGDTPLFKVPLIAGRHRIRAVRSDGKIRRLMITIEPATLFSSGTLTW